MLHLCNLLLLPSNKKNVTFNTRRAPKDSLGRHHTPYRCGVTKVAVTLWEVLTYSSRKLADLLAMRYACVRVAGRETTLVVSVPHCMCAALTFRAPPADSMLECGATCTGHPMPAESISIVGGCIGNRPARIPKLRTEMRFVRVPQQTIPRRSHRSHYLYSDIHNIGGEGGIPKWDYARIDRSLCLMPSKNLWR